MLTLLTLWSYLQLLPILSNDHVKSAIHVGGRIQLSRRFGTKPTYWKIIAKVWLSTHRWALVAVVLSSQADSCPDNENIR